MHLQNQLCIELFGFQTVAHVHHRNLDDVRRRALNRHVARHTFTERTHVEIGACKLRQIASAAEQRLHIAVFLRFLHHALHIVCNALIIAQVIVNIVLGLTAGNTDVL